MKRNFLRGFGVATAAAALALTGCSAGGTSGDGETLTIAVEYGGLKFPYHSALKAGVQAKADELGGIRIIEGDSNGDTGTELGNVQNLLARSPDCLLLIPVSNASSAAAENAQAANVPVVSFDQKAAGPTAAFVGYDQLQSGQMLGQFVVDQYHALGKPTIKVVYLRGLVGQAADTARNEGLKDTLSKAGLGPDKVQIIEQAADYDRAKAESITNNLLTQNPDTDVVVANNDDMILGAQSAARSLGVATGPQGKVHMAGIDGVPESLRLIADGQLDATMFQDPIAEAQAAVPTCVAAAKKQPVQDQVLNFRQVTQADAQQALDTVSPVYKS